ncbi:helix-turn-helix domain-containing protein [Deefgea rivuli]|jgi:putative transcriptional regulator|uniref:helix-turn-helix domain-containing protein n=1 Tax=Deefgea rivuli TaxID=400948 RepID=UPI001B805DF4|nr:helix-turn-helix transcriptional regulator [Deefgea rivuli]
MEQQMVKCHLSKIMGERRLKISDLARDTGLNRGTLTRLYHESAERIELNVVDALCTYFGCGVAELFEHIPNSVEKPKNQ